MLIIPFNMIKEEPILMLVLHTYFVLTNHPFRTLILVIVFGLFFFWGINIVFELLMSINRLFYHSYRMVVIIHSAQGP